MNRKKWIWVGIVAVVMVATALGYVGYRRAQVAASESGEPALQTSTVYRGDIVLSDTIGTYFVVYNVSDSVGNPADTQTRTVIVEDTIAPEVTLNPVAGGQVNPVTLEAGVDGYIEPGATLVEAGNAATTVVIGGDTVDANTVGTYHVTYTADDGVNLPIVVNRTVFVQDTIPPAIRIPAPGMRIS